MKTGSFKKSNNISQATAEGIFLYNLGNEYTSLTGGWEAAAITYVGDENTFATDQYTFSRLPEENPDHLYLNVPKTTSNSVFCTSVLKQKNSINYGAYSKIYVDCTANVGKTSGAQIIQFVVKKSDGNVYEFSNDYPDSVICYTENYNSRTIKGWNYKNDLSDIQDIYILVQSSKVSAAYCNIYKCWLEK